jgi:salicylate hydroxylase
VFDAVAVTDYSAMATSESTHPATNDLRVAIVGGGIGGRCALRFLRRAGLCNISLYERAPAVVDGGAGIQMSPNAVRLLERLGLGGQLRAAAIRLEVGWEQRRWQDGRVLFSQALGTRCEEEFGAPYYVVHRADLLRMLGAGRPDPAVHMGRRCVHVDQTGPDARLTLEDGSVAHADVVIGADGVHSRVQSGVGTPVSPRFSGLAAYRCLVPADRAPDLTRRPAFTAWLGPGRHLVHYPVSGGRLINVAAAVPATAWRDESWTARGRVADLVAEFAGWDERLVRLVSAAETVWIYAMHDREPLDRWVSGRVALLGDAAHPMLPAMAQGAAQAIEDAAVLARCLRGADAGTAPAALLRYQDARLPRATRIQRLSRGRPTQNHLPDGPEQRRRDAEFARLDPSENFAWIYGHDAEESTAAA